MASGRAFLPLARMQLPLVLTTGILLSSFLAYLAVQYFATTLDQSRSQTSFASRSAYIEIGMHTDNRRSALPYRLFLYREHVDGKTIPDRIHDDEAVAAFREYFSGHPVVFVHGHAGCYRQCQSYAAYCQAIRPHFGVKLDYFTVDFKEELSAFSGDILERQIAFLRQSIRTIVRLYARNNNPQKATVVGHSMGGIVAKGAAYLDDHGHGREDYGMWVRLLVTLNAPHVRPIGIFDRKFDLLFAQIQESHAEKISIADLKAQIRDNLKDNIKDTVPPLVSFLPGSRDITVPSELAFVRDTLRRHTLSILATEIPFVWSSMDHQMMLWSFPFVKALHLGLVHALALQDHRQHVLLDRLASFWTDDLFRRPANGSDRCQSSTYEMGHLKVMLTDVPLSAGDSMIFTGNQLSALDATGKEGWHGIYFHGTPSLLNPARLSTSLVLGADYLLFENVSHVEIGIEDGLLSRFEGIIRRPSDSCLFSPLPSRRLLPETRRKHIDVPSFETIVDRLQLPALVLLPPKAQQKRSMRHESFRGISTAPQVLSMNTSYLSSMLLADETLSMGSAPKKNRHFEFGRLAACGEHAFMGLLSRRHDTDGPENAIISWSFRGTGTGAFLGRILNYHHLVFETRLLQEDGHGHQHIVRVSHINAKYQLLRFTLRLVAKQDERLPPKPLVVSLVSQEKRKYYVLECTAPAQDDGAPVVYSFSGILSSSHFRLDAFSECWEIAFEMDPRFELHNNVIHFAPETILGIAQLVKWYYPWIAALYPVAMLLLSLFIQHLWPGRLSLKRTCLLVAAILSALVVARHLGLGQQTEMPVVLELLFAWFSASVFFLLSGAARFAFGPAFVVDALLGVSLDATKLASVFVSRVSAQLDQLLHRLIFLSRLVLPFHVNLFIFFATRLYFKTHRLLEPLVCPGLVAMASVLGMALTVHSVAVFLAEISWRWSQHPFAYFPNVSMLLAVLESRHVARMVALLPPRAVSGLLFCMATYFGAAIAMGDVWSSGVRVYPLAVALYLAHVLLANGRLSVRGQPPINTN